MSRDLPQGETSLIPEYYTNRNISDYVSLWVKLSAITDLVGGGLNELHVANTLSSVPRALATSIAAMFIVREGRGVDY